jgi:hypothetical protein
VQKNSLAAAILLDEAVTLLVVPSLDFALKTHVFRMDDGLTFTLSGRAAFGASVLERAIRHELR